MEPITRSEQYLASILGEDVVLPIPQSRIEYYLNAIAQNGIAPSSAGLINYDPDANYPDGSIGKEMHTLDGDVDQLKSQINGLFSQTARSIGTSSIWYSWDSDVRVSLKNGLFLYLRKGQVISMSKADTRVYIGWYSPKTGEWKGNGWVFSPDSYTLTEDGFYTVTFSRWPEQTEESVEYLVSAFCIDGKPLKRSVVSGGSDDSTAHENLAYETVPGFLASDGTIAGQNESHEVTTGFVAANLGVTYEIVVTFPTGKAGWTAIGEYGAGDTFIQRIVQTCNEKEYTLFYTVTNPAVKYLRFSWRTYDVAAVDIKVKNSSAYAANLTHDLYKDIGFLNANSAISNIHSISHRGFYAAPENTIPAFKLSKRNGFSSVEVDVRFTSDGTAVLLHDESINRTARNADGTALSSTVNIADITYEDALDYDFGIYKGSAYEGTKIPTFEEALKLFRALGIRPYIELKAGTQAQIEGLVDTVLACGMSGKVTWISQVFDYLSYVKGKDERARLGLLAGSITSGYITSAQSLKTETNEVFLDSSDYSDAAIALCVAAKIPLEVWTINSAATIASLNPYITGVTSDTIVAAYALMIANSD